MMLKFYTLVWFENMKYTHFCRFSIHYVNSVNQGFLTVTIKIIIDYNEYWNVDTYATVFY